MLTTITIVYNIVNTHNINTYTRIRKEDKDMYKIGDTINIGYYGGFHNRDLIKSQAKIIDISGNLITIIVYLQYGGLRRMFGYDHQLKEMESNYNK